MDTLRRTPSPFCTQHGCVPVTSLSLTDPVVQRGQLVCGVRGKHVVADYELKTMIDDIEMEDILSVYVVRARRDPRWAGWDASVCTCTTRGCVYRGPGDVDPLCYRLPT